MIRNSNGKLPKFKTKTYVAWQNMRQRCNDPNREDYTNYGGRGITVCNQWADYYCFLSDMGEAPLGKSLDRLDNNKGYSKENCRWATHSEQMNNRRPRSVETKLRYGNSTGISGVYWVKQKETWQVKTPTKRTATFYSLLDAAAYRLSPN